MPSTAQTAQQSALRVQTAVDATPETITDISSLAPPVVTVTTAPATGTVVEISGVVGMTEVNGRAFVVTNVSGTTFSLNGVDATGYTTYVSGGTSSEHTFTKVGNVKDFDIQQDESTEIDVTNLDSTRKEFQIGLAGSWTASCNYDIDNTDTGQSEFEVAQGDGQDRVFSLTLLSGAIFTGIGYVKSTSATGSPDAVVSGTVSIRGTGQPSWFV